jgi:hypothetical protein
MTPSRSLATLESVHAPDGKVNMVSVAWPGNSDGAGVSMAFSEGLSDDCDPDWPG